MRYSLLTCIVYLICSRAGAQNSGDLIKELQSIHQSVLQKKCGTDSAAAISNRAMNVFLADKTGYLPGNNELSFYTNYTSFNTAEGRFTVNHRFQKPRGIDEPVRKLFSIGFDMTIAGSYTKAFLDKRFENELGIDFNYTWPGKVKTRFADCAAPGQTSNQKNTMDALRAALLQTLMASIQKEELDFNQRLETMDSSLLPGQDLAAAKKQVAQQFYAEQQATYEEKFASFQASLLTQKTKFKLVSTHWTSVTAYAPLFFPKYTVAASLVSGFNNEHPYPFQLTLGHTRFWESAGTGRLFITLDGSLLLNNSKLSYGLSKLNFSEYKSLGGTVDQSAADPGNNKLYIGDYKTFVTPALMLRVVYFPPTSHVGISLLAEQNFGQYNLLQAKLGIPIVLINSKKTPAVNIECYALFLNLTDRKASIDKTSIGLSIGVPFSRLMY